MRVLVVSAWDPADLTHGDSLILRNHLRWLAADHEITVLVPRGPAHRDAPLRATMPASVAVRYVPWHTPRALDYLARRIRSLATGVPAHVYWVARPELRWAMAVELARRPDVVHLFGWGSAALCDWVPDVPVVHMAVDVWAGNETDREARGWRRLLEHGQAARVDAHERRYYPRVAAVVVVTEAEAERLRKRIPAAHVVVVGNGVDAGPDPGPPSGEPVLGFHGVLARRPNVDAARTLVADVLPLVRRQVPNARALLVGRAPVREVREMASTAVEIASSVPDVRPWLEKMAVYVAPMVSGAGIKNKVLEAMAAGLPVVTTSVGATGIGGGPGVVVADEPRAMVDTIVAMLADPVRRVEAGMANRRCVLEDFSWEKSARVLGVLWVSASTGTRSPTAGVATPTDRP